MAVKEVLVDDIDGETEAVGVLTFVVDGQEFEADLGEDNMAHYQGLIDEHEAVIAKLQAEHSNLMRELSEYGRPVVRRMGQVSKSKPKHTPAELAEIREWLRGQGHQVKDFGRIKDSLMEKWETRSRMPKAGGETEVHGHGDPKAVTNAEGK